jgi:hypothetical protein
MIIKRKLYSSIDVNAEGRGGALIGGTAGFLPGTLIGAAYGKPIAGMAIGTLGGAAIGRSIARSKAKNKLQRQLEEPTKIIPTAKDISTEINKVSTSPKADELRRVIQDIYSDPRNKDFDDIEYNDIQSLGDSLGKFRSPLEDGSIPVATLNYYEKDEIVEKDGKLYLSSYGVRDKDELTKEKLLKHLDSNREKWYDPDEEQGWVDYDSPVPRDPNNPYDKKILDYTDYISEKIKNSKL